MRWLFSLTMMLGTITALSADDTPRDFNKLVGTWKGAGAPEGSIEARQKGHWSETLTVIWKFAKNDSWLDLQFADGKLFTKAILKASADGKKWTWTATRPDKTEVVYQGTWDGKQFSLVRSIPETKMEERLIVSLLHDNRFIYRTETHKTESTLWTKTFQVGLTKEGVAFAETGDGDRECIVSGGRGTMTVSYEGKTYYVCCTGCRDEFKEDPKKYVLAWEAKKKKK
ncbi:YHS domain-containing protein [Zavarzinella formosa]|uniref:YHS domain-containing protein n=1 Tax=Zavarzinella formosa TaxID=360055 RepID=UPI0002FD6BBF|nr:YHS domain-containing protein [Zavarzinella formosa]